MPRLLAGRFWPRNIDPNAFSRSQSCSYQPCLPSSLRRPFFSGSHIHPPWSPKQPKSTGNLTRSGLKLLLGGLTAGLLFAYSAGYLPSEILRNESNGDNQDWQISASAVDARKTNAELHRKIQQLPFIGDRPARGFNSQVDVSGSEVENADRRDEDTSAWAHLSEKALATQQSLTSIEWSSIPDTVTEAVLPDSVRVLPGYISKLQRELSMAPGSLSAEIWQEAQDPYIHPEITRDACVRVSDALCEDERRFLRARRRITVTALAKYLDIPEEEINPEDVPTIAMCGSGGGLRALVAGTGSYLSAQEAGLFDCVTYTAGVSGSCWLQTLYHSSVGGRRFDRMVEHLKARIGIHMAFPISALALLDSAPTNKFLLTGLIEKLRADPDGSFGLVDIYGLLLAGRLLVPKGELGVDMADLQLSNQRHNLTRGRQPMPIYTAVRHEIPLEETESAMEKHTGHPSEARKESAKQEAFFQWFEFTPYELWCEEMQAGIPTWAIGRKFLDGRSVCDANNINPVELKIPLLMGIWGSAFCATLSHYYKEIRPLVKSITGFSSLDQLIAERDEDLVKVHPIEPASIPNYVLGMRARLPGTCPESVFHTSHLQLMDAGMSNNLPIYPLLRPGREVDILIAFDASADIRTENWLSVADGYARQRGIRGWPIGTGWPKKSSTPAENASTLEAAEASTPQEAASKVAGARQQQQQQQQQQHDTHSRHSTDDADLGYCTIWVGTTEERSSPEEPPPSKRNIDFASPDWKLMEPHAGMTLIYFPLLKNEEVPGVDPEVSEFLSTWNSVYTPEQIDSVVALARANFKHGEMQTKRAVRAVYERKKRARVRRFGEEMGDHIVHGDYFS